MQTISGIHYQTGQHLDVTMDDIITKLTVLETETGKLPYIAPGLTDLQVWAGIWPLALDGLGRYTKKGASILIMGLCGNAILPLVYGHFADQESARFGYWVLVPCYLYLAFYALYGYKMRRWGTNRESSIVNRQS